MREWDISPYDLKAVGHGIADADARKLIDLGLLPEDELHDGLILVETALAGVPCLVTSDRHLLRIDKPKLAKALANLDLPMVQIFDPDELLRLAKPT